MPLKINTKLIHKNFIVVVYHKIYQINLKLSIFLLNIKSQNFKLKFNFYIMKHDVQIIVSLRMILQLFIGTKIKAVDNKVNKIESRTKVNTRID